MAKNRRKAEDNKPISRNKIDVAMIKHNASTQMVSYAWLCLLGALIDFPDTTKESIIQLWKDVSALSEERAATYGRMSNWAIKEIGQTVGLRHVTVPNFDNVRTQRDLNRFIRKVDERAMQATLAIIVQPLMDRGYSIEFLRRLIEKTYGISDSVKNKELALFEINDALAEEYSLVLYTKDGAACLTELKEQK